MRVADAAVRARLVMWAVIAASAGMGSRYLLASPVLAKYLGVALWATLVHALVLIVHPRLSVRRAFAVALAISVAVELFQLTPVPRALAAEHVMFAMVLGAYFSPWDFPAYLFGVALGAVVHHQLTAPRGRLNRCPPVRPS